MAYGDDLTTARGNPALPSIRKIGTADLWDALDKGLDDFKANPSFAVLLAVIYPVIGLVLGRLVFGYDVLPLLYPLAAGFALMGPLAAIGFYEVSRLREQGRETAWADVLGILRSPSIGAIAILGFVLMVVFLVWLTIAHTLYVESFGYAAPESISGFASQILDTPTGWRLAVIGNAVGFLFAAAVFVTSALSFPLLLDRNVGPATAVVTSVRAFLVNPVTMTIWGLIVAVVLALGCLPFFFGLAVAVPVLGHATWHLYRKVVGP